MITAYIKYLKNVCMPSTMFQPIPKKAEGALAFGIL